MSSSLRQIRRERGLTQAQLAVKAHVGVKTLHFMEHGIPVLPAQAEAVASALSLTLADLPNVKIVNRMKSEETKKEKHA